MPLSDLSPADLETFRAGQQEAYDALVAAGLTLDLTRGKPSAAQLDLSEELTSLPRGHRSAEGVDTRNYGGLTGLLELREIFAELLGLEVGQLVVQGNSSLTLMSEVLIQCLLRGAPGSLRPWGQEEKVTFICPVPGYDRHFTLLAHYGIEMVTVPMTPEGPDPDAVEALVAQDPSVKGMWVVPTYANPTGEVCSPEVARRLASMPTAAPDFTIFWDNAYAVHHLTDDAVETPDIVTLAAQAGHPDRVVLFASTSKITFAGAGVSFLGGSEGVVAWYLSSLAMRSIGPDKVNHLRHAQFFGDAKGVLAHMERHREIIAPKFAEVSRVLSERLGEPAVATWTDPAGGYFVNLEVPDGTASRVIALAKAAGIALTPAGSAFPHGDDPRDAHIRLAPTLPPVEEVTSAMEGVATCVLLAAAQQALETSAG